MIYKHALKPRADCLKQKILYSMFKIKLKKSTKLAKDLKVCQTNSSSRKTCNFNLNLFNYKNKCMDFKFISFEFLWES